MKLLCFRPLKRLLISVIILIIFSNSANAQKMDTLSINGKWISIDTLGKKSMIFYFGDDSAGSLSYDGKSLAFTYFLAFEDSKQVLAIMTSDKRLYKHALRRKSKTEIELFISKNVDLNSNIRSWGLNESIILNRE
jgi:hypothetical protein